MVNSSTITCAVISRLIKYAVLILGLCGVMIASMARADIAGRVFIDANIDGVFEGGTELGAAGMIVTATGKQGNQVQTTTALDGTYHITTIDLATPDQIKVVFSKPMDGSLDYLSPGYASGKIGSGGPVVVFSKDNQTEVNVGLTYVGDKCVAPKCDFLLDESPEVLAQLDLLQLFDECDSKNISNVQLMTTRFHPGDRNGIWADAPAVVSFDYTDSGSGPSGWNAYTPDLGWKGTVTKATVAQVGAVYGTAHDRDHKLTYVSSFQKLGTDYGPGGPSAIYSVSDTGAVQQYIRLDDIFGANTAGANPHNLSGNMYDIALYDAPSKMWAHRMSFGDIDLSSDGAVLYAVNLFDKNLYVIPTNGPLNNATVKRYAIPQAPSCAAEQSIPFAIGIHKDTVYAGVTCVGPAKADLKAHIFQFDGSGFISTPVHSFDFNGAYYYLEPWTDTTTFAYPDFVATQHMATLTDIEFDGNDMVFSLRSRLPDMFNAVTLLPAWSGELFKSCYDASSHGWVREVDGTCGGIDGEGKVVYKKFFEPAPSPYSESRAAGGLYMVPGLDLVMSVNNPIWFWSGGTIVMNRNGDMEQRYEHYAVGPDVVIPHPENPKWVPYSNFQKLNGIGDITGVCDSFPVEIGNRIWRDVNHDGIQQPGEPAMSGIAVNLIDDTSTIVGSAKTNGNGNYYFGGPANVNMNGNMPLLPAASYRISIMLSQPGLSGLVPTMVNQGGDDELDSDGVKVGNSEVYVSLITPHSGQGVHSYDFGFSSAPPHEEKFSVKLSTLDTLGVTGLNQSRLAVRLAGANGGACRTSKARSRSLINQLANVYKTMWTTIWTKLPQHQAIADSSEAILAYDCSTTSYEVVLKEIERLHNGLLDIGDRALRYCPSSVRRLAARRKTLLKARNAGSIAIASFPTYVLSCAKSA